MRALKVHLFASSVDEILTITALDMVRLDTHAEFRITQIYPSVSLEMTAAPLIKFYGIHFIPSLNLTVWSLGKAETSSLFATAAAAVGARTRNLEVLHTAQQRTLE